MTDVEKKVIKAQHELVEDELDTNSEKLSALDGIVTAIVTAIAIALTGVFAYGSFIIGRQVYYYVRLGKWEEYSIIRLLKEWDVNSKWAQDPQDWLGAWQMLDSINAGLFIVILWGVFLLLLNSD